MLNINRKTYWLRTYWLRTYNCRTYSCKTIIRKRYDLKITHPKYFFLKKFFYIYMFFFILIKCKKNLDKYKIIKIMKYLILEESEIKKQKNIYNNKQHKQFMLLFSFLLMDKRKMLKYTEW